MLYRGSWRHYCGTTYEHIVPRMRNSRQMREQVEYDDYWDRLYQQRLKEGILYQDYICEQLHALGIVLQNMGSQRYQLRRENLLGLEIKYDKLFRGTGNLYVETHEKTHPANTIWVNSGIYRADACWLYAIGDYHDLWLFGKRSLQRLDVAGPSWIVRPRATRTSKGFCIPIKYAYEIAEKHCSFRHVDESSDLSAISHHGVPQDKND